MPSHIIICRTVPSWRTDRSGVIHAIIRKMTPSNKSTRLARDILSMTENLWAFSRPSVIPSSRREAMNAYSLAPSTILMLLLPYADEEQHAYGYTQDRKRDTEHRARAINLRHVWIGGDREGGALNCPHAEPDSCRNKEKKQAPAENYERVSHDVAP